jgi:MFS family permease
MTQNPDELQHDDDRRWYEGITRYQWLVLIIACLGWIFDIFEGQIFVASMNEAMPTFIDREVDEAGQPLGEEARRSRAALYNNVALGAFLLGGAVGGILFGVLSDKLGRKRTLSLTILFYSLFTCLSAFSMEWWHLAGLRFLVAMGVGGEWAVASSLVFEVFPRRARAHVGGIFHASSVLGTYLAVAAGVFIIANEPLNERLIAWARQIGVADEWILGSLKWRLGFALGALPAFLIIWIRLSLREPESWQRARDRAAEDSTQQVGRITDLFDASLVRNTLVGFTLAAVGMATFWGVHIYGKDVLRNVAEESYLPEGEELSRKDREEALKPHTDAIKRYEMLGMFLVTTGGGIGLICFGPISQALGRRGGFLLYHLGGMVTALILFQVPLSQTALYVYLPIFGFLTLGMHAGYAIYFPELFPTRLRGTGAGFCFNGGRIAAAPVLFLIGWLQSEYGLQLTLEQACSLLSVLYLAGAGVLVFARETRHEIIEA